MLRRPETQDPVFSTQIENACSASSAKRSRFTQRKATKTLLNTSFPQWQFATLCRSNSDPDVIAKAGSSPPAAAMRLPPSGACRPFGDQALLLFPYESDDPP